MVDRIDQETNGSIKRVSSDWQSLERMLDEGQIDALFGLYYSEERAKVYTFGPEIFRNRVYFYLRKTIDAPVITKLYGKRIAVAGESSFLRTHAEAAFPQIEWVVFPNLPQALEAMRSDPSLLGVFEEEAIAETNLALIDFIQLSRFGGPQLERSLHPVSLSSRPEIMQRLTAALDGLESSDFTLLRAQWITSGEALSDLTNPENHIALSDHEKAYIAKNPIIRYAGDPSWPPVSFLSADGEFQGIQHDVLKLIADRTGLRFEKPLYQDWSEVRQAVSEQTASLRSGSIDEHNSSVGYLQLPLVLVAPYTTPKPLQLADYVGKKVTIEEGNAYGQTLANRYPDIEFISVEVDQDGLDAVAVRDASAHVGNYAVCSHLVQRNYASSLKVIDIMSEAQTLSFVAAESSDLQTLLGILNQAIASIDEREMKTIYDRWIQADVQKVTNWSSWWKPLAIFAFCLLLIVLWQVNGIRLKRAMVQADERLLLAKKAGAGGQFEWFPKTGKVKYSPEFFEILGYGESDLEHSEKTVVKLTHPEDLKRSMPRQALFIREGKEYEHKLRMRRSDGSWAWIILRGVPTHFHKDGSVKRYIGIQMDVTELQEANKKMREQQNVAQKANQAKSEFLANMSHEIRTPMNAILGFSRLLKRDPSLSSQQSEYVHLINTSSEHLLSLLDSILDMSKIESRKISLLELKVDLPNLLHEISSILKARCAERGLAYYADLSETLPNKILADGTKLRQIILNLAVNAVKFTEEGKITLRAYAHDKYLSVEVADTGCGISKEEMKNLFQPFSQGEAGQKQSRGTGLGLTISREFCQLMGGELSVTSTPAQGSTFIAKLPFEEIESSERDEEHTKSIHIPYKAAATKSLLVVDDKLSNLQYMERFLSDHGFQIRLATDGESALAQWKLYNPDLILLDIRMPKLDGYEVVKRIRADKIFRQPKILALTASAFNQQRQRILDLGADRFMTKPFNEDQLLETIAELTNLTTTSVPKNRTRVTEFPPAKSNVEVHMTAQQKQDLIDACLGGYFEKIESVIYELQPEQPEAAASLLAFAKTFDYEQIAEIAESCPLANPPNQ